MMDFVLNHCIQISLVTILAALVTIFVVFVYAMLGISSMCERDAEELERQRMIELSKKKDEESGGFNG